MNRRSPFRSVVHFPDCVFKLQSSPWSDIIHPSCLPLFLFPGKVKGKGKGLGLALALFT